MKIEKYIGIAMLCLAFCGCIVEMDNPDMSMKTTLGLTLPIGEVMVYNYKFVSLGEGEFAFEDTIRHINLSKIDFATASDNDYVDTVVLSDIWLFLTITNELPVNIQLEYTCYDDDGEKADIHFFDNSIKIDAATYKGDKIVATQQLNKVGITNEQLQTLKTTGTMTYKCVFEDAGEVVELDACHLKMHIGLCANINASLNLDPDE